MNYGLLNAAANMLANSGPSRTPTSFGQIAGQGLLGYMQGNQYQNTLNQQDEQNALKKQMMEMQMNRAAGGGLGKYNPGDYTPDSWVKAVSGENFDPSQLVRYEPKKTITSGGVEYGFDPASMKWYPMVVGGKEVTPESVGGDEATISTIKKTADKELEAQFEAPEAYKTVEYAATESEYFIKDAERLLNHPGLSAATGFGGETWSGVSGTEAADAKAILQTMKSKSFISALSAMRASSKTGGAVGNVSDAEGAKFENKYTSLLQSQSTDQFKENLKDLISQLEESNKRIKEAYKHQYGNVKGARMFEDHQTNGESGGIKFLGFE